MLRTIVLLVGVALVPASGQSTGSSDVSPQGRLIEARSPLVVQSPGALASVSITPVAGDFCGLTSDLVVRKRDGAEQRLAHVHGHAFFVTDEGRVVAIESTHSEAVPSRLTVFGVDGTRQHVRRVPVFSDPVLAADGAHLVYRSRGGVEVLDLATFGARRHPNLAPLAALAGGGVVGALPGGELVQFAAAGEVLRATPAAAPLALVPGPRGRALFVLTRSAVQRLDLVSGTLVTLFVAPAELELRDLRVARDALHVGARSRDGARSIGHALTLAPDGRLTGISQSAPSVPLAQDVGPSLVGAIPWPLAPNAQHPVGNSYGEYQKYGGSPYLHPGVDVLGADGQPVYAVADGVVKAVLTTSGQYHWRVAIADAAGAGTSTGYLYAHLDLPSIAVSVGDVVTRGQYLGDLVPWPVAGFTHCHFARIEDTGAQWFGDWTCTDNPHVRFENQSESEAPVFENALGSELFAFCVNETSSYLDPNALSGAVDVVVHVGDRVVSTWVCAVQELRLTIYPAGAPDAPVVSNRVALRCDMALDTYRGGVNDAFLVDLLYKQDGTCMTEGDYGDREFFHVITNSNGDLVYDAADQQEAWDTTSVPNGAYVIEVTAIDAAGNAANASMTVTVSN